MKYQELKAAVEAKCLQLKRPMAKIIAVCKGEPVEAILKVYQEGCRDFGENRLNELLLKKELLPKDIAWHLIGPIQSKKVNKAIGAAALIHSVDSISLAHQLSTKSQEKGPITPILLQSNTSGEATKSGLPPSKWIEAWDELKNCPGIRILGLMTMAPLTEDRELIRATFRKLKELASRLSVDELSMGMSFDWPLALEEGATYLRIGRSLFQDI